MPKLDGRTLDHNLSEHLRVMAVRRVVEDGESPRAVIDSMGLNRTTIYRWLETYEREGYEGLKGTKSGGPEPKLNEKQCQRIRTWIVGKDPRQFGFDFGLWTRSIVRALIKERLGVEVSLATVGTVLSRLNITPQKPLRRAYERDPEAVKHWIEQEYPQLRKRAKSRGASIFFLDEAGFSSEPNLGRTYGAKGKTPVVRTTGQRQKVNAISAVNAKGAFWCVVYTGKLNAETFVAFLKDFLKGRRSKVFLVVDGHPSHRAKLVQEFVQSTQGRLELHFLPPYAPDLNPDEFVWQYAKTNGIAKKPLKQNEPLLARVEADLCSIGQNKSLVRSFFRAPSVAYAADL
jgi:transposase